MSLSSEGGDAVAVVIGNYIRLSGMKTLVPENKKCVSVCAIIWLGARDRYVGGGNTAVGFHGVYNKNTGQPGSLNIRIAVYLGYLDLSYDAVDWVLGAPPLAIRWLTSETSKQYGIHYWELMPKRSVPFVDEQVADKTPAPSPPSQVPTSPQARPAPPQLPQQSPQTQQPKRPFRVVDASDGYLNIRTGEAAAGRIIVVCANSDAATNPFSITMGMPRCRTVGPSAFSWIGLLRPAADGDGRSRVSSFCARAAADESTKAMAITAAISIWKLSSSRTGPGRWEAAVSSPRRLYSSDLPDH